MLWPFHMFDTGCPDHSVGFTRKLHIFHLLILFSVLLHFPRCISFWLCNSVTVFPHPPPPSTPCPNIFLFLCILIVLTLILGYFTVLTLASIKVEFYPRYTFVLHVFSPFVSEQNLTQLFNFYLSIHLFWPNFLSNLQSSCCFFSLMGH